MKNFTNDTTVTIKTDLSSFTKKDLNFLLGEDGNRRYNETEIKNVTQKAMADDLHNQLLDAQPKRSKKMSDGTVVAAVKPAFIPRDSKNVACAASKKTNLIKAVVAGKKTVDLAIQIVAGDPTLTAYWGETVLADLNNALLNIRPAAVRAEAAAARKAEAAIAKANKPVKERVTITVDVTPDTEVL